MLRLAVDLRPLLEPFESGVTQYASAMLRELLKRRDVELDLFYQARQRCERIHEKFPSVRHLPISNTVFHLRSLLGTPRLPADYFKVKPDLIWIPDRRPFYKTGIPLVMTVHDRVPELCARTLSLKGRLWHRIFNLKRLLRLCSGVLLPSFTSGASLPSKLLKEVSYEGAELAFAVEPARQPTGDFFLAISPCDPRKRLPWIFKMAQRFPKFHFVVLGLKPGDSRFANLRLQKLKNLELRGPVTEGEKTWFLRHAAALLALSSYEGFDLPVLEAVTAKCPVILSDIAVHHELYKEAWFVKTEAELEAALYRSKHSKIPVPKPRGIYTWEKAAERALLLFGRVLHHKD